MAGHRRKALRLTQNLVKELKQSVGGREGMTKHDNSSPVIMYACLSLKTMHTLIDSRLSAFIMWTEMCKRPES